MKTALAGTNVPGVSCRFDAAIQPNLKHRVILQIVNE